jgi:hypothetical protein
MKIFLIIIGIIIVGGFIWNAYNTVTMDVHYKLTITLDTPEGEVSGSTVRAIWNRAKRYQLIDWPASGNPAQERGEAVVVDMPNGKKLFGLIASDSDRELFYSFPSGNRGATTFEGIQFYKNLSVGSKADVYVRFWPKMVTFTDMDDPKTVKQVLEISRCEEDDIDQGICPEDKEDKFAITENKLEEYFGEGVSIKSVTVEITDEPVTRGVVDEFLPEYDDEFWEWFKTLNYGDPRRIGPNNF